MTQDGPATDARLTCATERAGVGVKMPWFRTVLCAATILAIPPPALASEAATAVVDQARADCRAFEDGVLETTDEAITLIDLTGDGRPDELVDAAGFHCSSGNLFCGTGGCPVTAIVDGAPTEFLAKGWTVVDWGPLSVLLLQVHGSACGGTNLRTCVEAVVWSEDGFRSVRSE